MSRAIVAHCAIDPTCPNKPIWAPRRCDGGLSPTRPHGSADGRAEAASVAWRVSTVSQGAQEIAHTSTPHLSRQLGMWAIVGLGLGYMTPMTVFDTFGIVSE